jgi:hypothetical protein
MPRVSGDECKPLQIGAAAVANNLPESKPDHDGKRHERERQEKQHRHEEQLCRDTEARTYLERNLRSDRVRPGEDQKGYDRRRPRPTLDKGQRNRNQNESSADDEGRPALTDRQGR